ncbi:hypothetical protein C8F01DRAFT_1255790 [Mycena amicta]|nr:hypothetical protein C8F01DRAFT_1255790 [Mycena amicta]
MSHSTALRSPPLPNATTIHAPPSPSDTQGTFYLFLKPHSTYTAAKLGRSKYLQRRKHQWAAQCRPQRQVWIYWWDVPFASKFENLVHLHFKHAGAWIRPSLCRYCRKRHHEKFHYGACRGASKIKRVVEYYLWRLGWLVNRVRM